MYSIFTLHISPTYMYIHLHLQFQYEAIIHTCVGVIAFIISSYRLQLAYLKVNGYIYSGNTSIRTLLNKDTSINRTLSSVANVTFV